MPTNLNQLQAKFDELLRIAKNNERKQSNFQEYELDLLNCSDLFELLSLILNQHRDRFQLSEVTLLLLDPEYEFQRLLDLKTLPETWQNRLLFTDNEHAINQFFSAIPRPRLSAFSTDKHQQLFPNKTDLQSVAILPLVRQHKLIACLNLGSNSTSRFASNMATQFLQHLAAVISACIENARLQENIKQLGLSDPLTGINNRRFFDQRVEEEVNKALRNKEPLSCLFIDLDHFKQVNDTHGHQVGDSVLKKAAQLLDDAMRTGDVLARYGGEEFVILLADTDRNTAHDIAERIRRTVADTDFEIDASNSLKATLSIGLAVMEDTSTIDTSKQLVDEADQAMYDAKTSGRNCVRIAK